MRQEAERTRQAREEEDRAEALVVANLHDQAVSVPNIRSLVPIVLATASPNISGLNISRLTCTLFVSE